MQPLLAQHLAAHQYLREELVKQFPETDEDTLRDTVEGLTSLPEILANILRGHLDDVALVTALRARIGDMQERAARLELRADQKRALVLAVMERADMRKLVQPDFSAFLRNAAPGLIVVNEAQIPEPFWRPQPAKLDRRGVLEALKAGHSVPGAALGPGTSTLSVRTR
jgi:Siphovirus Gp157